MGQLTRSKLYSKFFFHVNSIPSYKAFFSRYIIVFTRKNMAELEQYVFIFTKVNISDAF